jgi:hypothetical protein
MMRATKTVPVSGILLLATSMAAAYPPAVYFRTFGGDFSEDVSNCICPTSDGGYVQTGYTIDVDDGSDIFVAKFDSTGHCSWAVAYGSAGDDAGQACLETTDGHIIVVGYTAHDSSGVENTNVFVSKFDLGGTCLWTHVWEGPREDIAYDVIESTYGTSELRPSQSHLGHD